MIAVLIVLLLLLVVVSSICVYVVVRYIKQNASGIPQMSSTKGVNIDTGNTDGTEMQGGYSVDVKTGTCSMPQDVDVICLENCITRDSYRAELIGSVVIGRMVMGHPECNTIPVTDSMTVSRRHCRLYETNRKVYLQNLSKSGATRLNGKIIHHTMRIHTGDYIGIGEVQLRVTCIDAQKRHRS